MSENPSEVLQEIWTHYLRNPFDADLPDQVLALARETYKHLDTTEQCEAYRAFERRGYHLADEAPPPTRATFCIEDLISVEGYDDGSRWNGWCEPLIPVAKAKEVTDALTALGKDEGEDQIVYTFHEKPEPHVVVTYPDPYGEGEERTTLRWFSIRTANGSIEPVFSFGLGLIWTLKEE